MPSLRAARRAAALLPVLVLALLLGAASAGARPDPPGAPVRPNIVLVLTDDLTADLIPFLPQVQAMQREGVSFDRYIVSDSLCCPSRASLFTGRYPHNTGVLTNVAPDGGRDAFVRFGGEDDNVALDLQRAGYRTALMGKYLNGYAPGRPRVPPGWDTWAVAGKGYHGFHYKLNVDGAVSRYGGRPREYLTDVLRRRGLRFIDESVAAARPFFLELATFAPHGPATPAPRDARRFAGLRAPRDAAWDASVQDGPSWLSGRAPLDAAQIAALDERFRRRAQSVLAVDDLLQAVRERLVLRGVLRDTYVVFTSDNGFHLGQHRLMPGKMTAFDHDVRVPLVVTGPGVPAGTHVGALTQNVDLRPTFTQLAGTRPRGPVDGASLVPALRGLPLEPWRTGALIEHQGPDLDPSDPDYQSAPGGNPTTYEALRVDDGLFVASENGEREFYDLRADPAGLRNVYSDLGAERRADLEDRLDALAVCAGPASCRR